MAVELPASEDESAARATIAQAGDRAGQRRSDIPASFVAQLYGRAVPEDVLRYGAADLAVWPSGRSIFWPSGRRARRKSAARRCR